MNDLSERCAHELQTDCTIVDLGGMGEREGEEREREQKTVLHVDKFLAV